MQTVSHAIGELFLSVFILLSISAASYGCRRGSFFDSVFFGYRPDKEVREEAGGEQSNRDVEHQLIGARALHSLTD